MMLVPRRYDFDLFDNFFDSDNFYHPVTSRECNLMKTDVRETSDKYIIIIDLPGYEKNNINLSLTNGYLKVHASIEKNVSENNEEKFIRKERFIGEISRSFYVGKDTDTNDMEAEFKNGVLTIEIMKKNDVNELNEPKKIEIK